MAPQTAKKQTEHDPTNATPAPEPVNPYRAHFAVLGFKDYVRSRGNDWKDLSDGGKQIRRGHVIVQIGDIEGALIPDVFVVQRKYTSGPKQGKTFWLTQWPSKSQAGGAFYRSFIDTSNNQTARDLWEAFSDQIAAEFVTWRRRMVAEGKHAAAPADLPGVVVTAEELGYDE